jgi:hypothetical protein
MFRFVRRTGGDCVAPIKLIPGKAEEVFSRGEPVNLESGLANAGAPADTYFVGISNQAQTIATAGDPLEVTLALPDVVFRAPFTNAGTKKTFTNADIGTAFDLLSTDNGVIDPDDTTGGAWIVVGFDNTLRTVDVVLDREKAANIVGGHADDIGVS